MTDFPWADFAEAERTGKTPAALLHWFMSDPRADAEAKRAAISRYLAPRLKKAGKPKAEKTIARLKAEARLCFKHTSEKEARAQFVGTDNGKLNPEQFKSAIAYSMDGAQSAEYKQISSGAKFAPDDS